MTQAIAALPHEARPERRRSAASARGGARCRRLARAPGRAARLHARSARRLLRVDGEDWVRIPREGARPITFLALDLDGVLPVRDPARFLARSGARLRRGARRSAAG